MATVKSCRRIMDANKLAHLPVVTEGREYVGVVSAKELQDAESPNALVESVVVDKPSVAPSHDVYGILALMSQNHYSVLPVVDDSNKYLGCITQTTLIDRLAEMTCANDPGGVLEIDTDYRNYSPATIANVAEYNSMKVMAMLSQPHGAHGVKSVLKLNGHDTTSIVQGLERNGYNVRQVRGGDTKYTDMLEERYDALLRYINA